MSLLRILRNLAVMVILTIGVISLVPHPVAAQSTCRPLGAPCSPPILNSQCCSRLCGAYGGYARCCNKPNYHQICGRSDVCCFGYCSFIPGKSYGYCS
jgi:hypothetical protein